MGNASECFPPVVCLAIFWNNIRASFVPMMGGMVPFLCLPVLLPLLNGGTLSLVAFDLKRKALNVPLIILVDIVPHGIFEVLGWLYSSCLGVYLSLRLGKRIISRRRQKEATVSVSNFFETYAENSSLEDVSLSGQILISFARVAIPLLLVGAVVESFITPLIHKAVFK